MRLLHRPLAVLVWAALSLGAASCSDEELAAAVAALGEGCLLDSDCSDDLICVFRRCHVECETTKDCQARATGTDCVLGDRTKVCLLPVEEPCVVEEEEKAGGVLVPVFLHTTCPSDQLLCARDGTCRNRCQADDDCVAGATCTITGVCAETDDAGDPANSINEEGEAGVVSATCLYSSECVAPLGCRDNQCRPTCLADADCTPDQRCAPVEAPSLGETFGACRQAGTNPDLPASCQNGMLDDGESDVDCGGAQCNACASGSACEETSDCVSALCTGGLCQVPGCSDGVKNANESDVDCGGPQCGPCGSSEGCFADADCAGTLRCDPATLTCVAPSCTDGVANGDETDVDCGGTCSTCGNGATCAGAGDCTSAVCVGSLCLAPTCSDGVKNGPEAGIDCGAPASGCNLCGIGATCTGGTDCATGSCQAGVCAAPTCSDGVENGLELGVDCGATCGQGCPLGAACTVDGDCDQISPAGCEPVSQLCTARYTVTASVTGAGTGFVTSTPAGLNCNGSPTGICAFEVYAGESVTLSPFTTGGTFAGFSGACTGPTCTLSVNADVSVTATFD